MLYKRTMGNAKAPASVIAAGIVAILIALFFLLSCVVGFLGVLLVGVSPGAPELPRVAKIIEVAMMGFLMCLSILGIATGLGLIYLRNWARISVLIWGGIFVFFAAVGVPFVFMMPNFSPPNAPQLPENSQQLIQWILVFAYSFPLLIGIWWLILFNRKPIKAQFTSAGRLEETGLLRKPRCPLPVTVLAWFYVTAILNLVFLPLIPIRIPVFLFGLALPGRAGLAVLLLSAVGFFAGGVGLLKLKPWSYSLTIGLQMFWLASTAVSMVRANYGAAMTSYMKDVQTWMHVPEAQFSEEYFAREFGWMMGLGLLFAGAILGLLVYYRPRFLEAAAAATASSGRNVAL